MYFKYNNIWICVMGVVIVAQVVIGNVSLPFLPFFFVICMCCLSRSERTMSEEKKKKVD